jgi:hypothetical protein
MTDCTTYIAGIRHHVGAADCICHMPDDSVLTLRREPENSHDRFAIVVAYGGLKLGYLPANVARNVSPVMDQAGLAEIRGRFNALDREQPSLTFSY